MLLFIANGIENILTKKLIGLYLFGSLTYGDFNPDSSDIDLVAIINQPLNHDELDHIKQLHKQIEEHFQNGVTDWNALIRRLICLKIFYRLKNLDHIMVVEFFMKKLPMEMNG